MNDQFKGPNRWHDYISALEDATPVIQALAVTDYYVTDTYETVRRFQEEDGRLPNVKLIFPNVEVRLEAATAKGGFVNLHLFVSPEDPNHVEELQRVLSRLRFNALGDRFDCTRADLMRLGKKADASIVDDNAAISYGASQFKVNFSELREVYNESDWAKRNILFAVAGGASDGTSGVRESADTVTRREIESFAHIIFASSQAQRDFWLGKKSSPDEIRSTYGGLKPCLHGSDAHDLPNVASPFGDRFSWIKGGLEFDALRQTCIDPQFRAHVGAEPPSSATPSQVVSKIEILGAPWMNTPSIPLNPGLVAIIGARGSGKTALADMIAAGCDGVTEESWNADEWSSPSFLVRARPLIGNARVEVHWGAGGVIERALDGADANGPRSYPRVRYLSQQFVEELCSSSGLTDGLLHEIERVIFEAHPEDTRDGALDFSELLKLRAVRHREAKKREAEAVAQISDRISSELEKEKLVASFELQAKEKKRLADAYTIDRAKLVSAGSEKLELRHSELATAENQIRARLRQLATQLQTLLALQDDVADFRKNQAPEALRTTQTNRVHSGLDEDQWQSFLLEFEGPVDTNLATSVKWVEEELTRLKGATPEDFDPQKPFFPENTDLSTLSQALLKLEMARLERLVSADREVQKQYSALSGKIATETAAFQSLTEKLEDANGAKGRARNLQSQREEAYGRAFDALVSEEKVLVELYKPLMERLKASSGTLKKLSFSVTRVADVEAWATEAEDLIDLRKAGPFKGKGALIERAHEVLAHAWQAGGSAEVVVAMAAFRTQYQSDLLSHSPVAHTDQVEFRAWSKKFAHWLFSTDHLSIHYGIEYDGVDIRKLSPGTRGIVLLLLYLALDDNDSRPLIIDQPEENLDPKSVFEELVGLFVDAKSHRQVIMVTHNANLVINTDADQIIIAESGPHPHGALPPITYLSGGLDNAEIRKAVCDILEGGEGAFKERARRLRVRLSR